MNRAWLALIPLLVTGVGIGIHYLLHTAAARTAERDLQEVQGTIVGLKTQVGPVLLLDKELAEAQPFLEVIAAYEGKAHDPVSYAQWERHIPTSLRPAHVTRTKGITVVEGRVGDGLDELVTTMSAAPNKVEKTARHFYLTLDGAQ